MSLAPGWDVTGFRVETEPHIAAFGKERIEDIALAGFRSYCAKHDRQIDESTIASKTTIEVRFVLEEDEDGELVETEKTYEVSVTVIEAATRKRSH